ncbi:hypothetical protein DV736_g1668, partial [Chaetothyriales sp. CBS 134916]
MPATSTARRSPSWLISLPTEVLTVLILSHLPPSAQICLALTCHRFHALILSSNELTKLDALSANLPWRPWKPFPYDTNPDTTFNDLMIRLIGFMGPKYRLCAMDSCVFIERGRNREMKKKQKEKETLMCKNCKEHEDQDQLTRGNIRGRKAQLRLKRSA